ncbi:hypothetical protein IC229_13660 [Spirosoma sp. BT702]|uniref:TMF family protein n=1 Tax=Spirosoma profusum TaxID=2771354 RepID=A0A926XW60_9BACT|nr:hypothetical protein [Spirosoma profusum]MBD2701692.1 hypothetical protein [Spirosoma profusum]
MRLRVLFIAAVGLGSAHGALAQNMNYVATNPSASSPGSYNTIVGIAAGGRNSTTGWSNVFMGNYAGFENISGENNVFSGAKAGYANRTGSRNVIVGEESGYAANGFDNTFIGFATGYFTSGSNNVIMGSRAGIETRGGSNNVFLGRYAGGANREGSNNIYIGLEAGYNNNNGHENVFLGFQAGYITQATANMFLGFKSGYANTSGQYNAFMGYQAGMSNTSGSGNVFAGTRSGMNNVTGTDNTFLGNNADALSRVVSLTNATAIGANARVATSNAIVLGDTTKNTKVGVGVTAPAFPLDVRGTINIRNKGSLKFAQRVQLQSDETEYLVLTAGEQGQSGLRLANLSNNVSAETASRLLSVDDQGRVGLYRPVVSADQVRLQASIANPWADYVFSPTYQLAPLREVADFVHTNQHLPGLPSAAEVTKEGIDLATLNTKLLEKVEELTLYLIEQQKQNTAQQDELTELRQQINELRKR